MLLAVDLDEQFRLFEQDIRRLQQQGKRIFASSSFQSHSLALLHMIHRCCPEVPVFFLNTGFHFPETLQFRDQVTEALGLNLQTLRSTVPRSQQRDAGGRMLFASDPDGCCRLNKTQLMDPILIEYDIWINGVRASQSQIREGMSRHTPAAHGCQRLHPLLQWDASDVHAYMERFALPRHPLEAEGYFSVGCRPCTRRMDTSLYDDRTGRWFGLNKVECGLHLELGAES